MKNKSNSLENDIFELNQKLSKEVKKKGELVELNEKLQVKLLELESKIKTLEERNQRSLKVIAEGNGNFETMLNMGKNKEDVTEIGYGEELSKPNKTLRI